MSRTDIMTEGTPVLIVWILLPLRSYNISKSIRPKEVWGESLSMTVPFQALQWTADILKYHLCTAGMLICTVFPWNEAFKSTHIMLKLKGIYFPTSVVLSLVMSKREPTICIRGQEFIVSQSNSNYLINTGKASIKIILKSLPIST